MPLERPSASHSRYFGSNQRFSPLTRRHSFGAVLALRPTIDYSSKLFATDIEHMQV